MNYQLIRIFAVSLFMCLPDLEPVSAYEPATEVQIEETSSQVNLESKMDHCDKQLAIMEKNDVKS